MQWSQSTCQTKKSRDQTIKRKGRHMTKGFIMGSYITKGAYLSTGRRTRHGHTFFVSPPLVPQKVQ